MDKYEKGGCALLVLYGGILLVNLGLVMALIWVAVHFIRKLW